MQEEYDILAGFDIIEIQEETVLDTSSQNVSDIASEASFDEMILEIEDASDKTSNQVLETKSSKISEISSPKMQHHSSWTGLVWGCIFMLKYCATSLCIFAVLMLAANYSAYFNLAYSIIYAEELKTTQKSLIESVAAASINEEDTIIEEKEVNTFKNINPEKEIKIKHTTSIHSMWNLTKGMSQEDIKLPIEITPYENRIIIPKIWKNIPLVDIKQQKVSGVKELNNIFMDELENWVIRYPWSAKPGENGNSFIFGHSSNFPWMKWDYNDVFSLLDHVTYDDEVVVYYGQEKHTYKIRTKNVISPGDVSVLENDASDDKSKLTLMTCWPIGTTLNRLVLTWDLISVE